MQIRYLIHFSLYARPNRPHQYGRAIREPAARRAFEDDAVDGEAHLEVPLDRV